MSRERESRLSNQFDQLVYRGQYNDAELYKQNDIVQHESRFWIYTFSAPNFNVTPQVPSNFWQDLGGDELIKAGLLSERPLASLNNKGRLYFVTDAAEQRLYYSTGTSWLLIGVAVPATTTKLGLVKLNTNNADPVVYRKEEIDTSITTGSVNATSVNTNNLTVIGLTNVPSPPINDSSNRAANTNFVQSLILNKDARFKDVAYCRLSLSGVSNEQDISSSNIIYLNPCYPNRPQAIANKGLIGLYVNGAWRLIEFSSTSLSISTLPSDKAYDVFVEFNLSTQQVSLSIQQWVNLGTRTNLYNHEGVLVKSSSELGKRYVGSFLTGVGGSTADYSSFRYVWNFYNRISKRVYGANTATGSYTYNTAAWTQAPFTPVVGVFSGWTSNFIDLKYVAPAVYCSVAVNGIGVYQYVSASINNASSVQIFGHPVLLSAPAYVQPSMVDLSAWGFATGKYTIITEVYSFQPPGGGTVTFYPMNSYLGGRYEC